MNEFPPTAASASSRWQGSGRPDKLARLFIPTCRQREAVLTSSLDSEPNPAAETEVTLAGVRQLRPSSTTEHLTTSGADWRAAALDLGFARVGVARLDDEALAAESVAKSRAAEWSRAGLHGPLAYMATPRLSPHDLLPSAKSVVVGLAVTEDVRATEQAVGHGRIAAYARGQDYHSVLKAKLWQLAEHLCNSLQQPIAARVCVDTAPILERFWAERAGVTFTGKSTMAIAPGVGTNVLIGLLLVDTELGADPRIAAGCGACTLCLDACPTAAFRGPFVLDAARCIATLTIESNAEIPTPLRAAIGDRVFGCDECQTVCPYNASRKRPGPLAELASSPIRRVADLGAWATSTSGDYKRLTKASALRRAPRAQLQRNAVVALGNSPPTPEASMTLLQVLDESPSPLVRSHAAWALCTQDPDSARQHLRTLCETEPDVATRSEFLGLLRDLERDPAEPPAR